MNGLTADGPGAGAAGAFAWLWRDREGPPSPTLFLEGIQSECVDAVRGPRGGNVPRRGWDLGYGEMLRAVASRLVFLTCDGTCSFYLVK